MIHIAKTQTGYIVATLGKNGEPLSCSEVLKSKQSCWKNIKAQMGLIGSFDFNYTYVQDDTVTPSVVYDAYFVGGNLRKAKEDIKPSKPYIPEVKKVKYKPKKSLVTPIPLLDVKEVKKVIKKWDTKNK